MAPCAATQALQARDDCGQCEVCEKEKEREKEDRVCESIWQHSALTEIDGHCVQVCLADP